MKTQKFTAPTMKEALAKVKEALGEDALIIKSEKVKSDGVLGFSRQEVIEVTAARPEEVKADLHSGPEFAETLQETLSKPPVQEIPERESMDLSNLNSEVKRLREDLMDIGKFIKYNNLPNMPRELVRVWETMGESGINKEWATDLAQDALVRLGAEELISAPAVENYLISKLSTAVRPAPQLQLKRSTPFKVMLVGAPGAGKTTLIQKLASDPLGYAKRKIGLISLDTHRMAAIEQIRAFARIAGTPLEVVFQPEQAAAALSRLASCEVILIDTPGCSVGDSDRRALMKQFIDALDPDEVHLIQNSSVRDEDLIFACRLFRDLGITHLGFTRLDESLRQGYLLNVVKAAERPVAWLSKGQGFMGCLERFTTEHLRRWTALTAAANVASEQPRVAEALKK
ncbi:MAG TPA: GTPase [bacterium]|jgi:flagellar biosynthesis protein FlhF